jgi:hypothetical protein
VAGAAETRDVLFVPEEGGIAVMRDDVVDFATRRDAIVLQALSAEREATERACP